MSSWLQEHLRWPQTDPCTDLIAPGGYEGRLGLWPWDGKADGVSRATWLAVVMAPSVGNARSKKIKRQQTKTEEA